MKNRIYLIIKIIVILLIAVLSISLVSAIKNLDLIPSKYIYILIGVLIVLNLIGSICLIIKKWYTKVISVFTYIIIIIVSIFGINFSNTTNEFLDKSFSTYKKEATTFYIMVRSGSKFKDLDDLTNKDISYFTFYNDTEKIIDEINTVIKNADIRPHDDLYDTFINFLVGGLSAVVIDDGYLDVLSENYKNLDNRLRILHTFEIESLVKEDEEQENSTTVKEEVATYESINKGNSINIYISGSDSRSSTIYNKSRSDVNMILSINPDTKTILLTSIPRDYYVQVHGQTGLKDKLTHTGIYGLNKSKETLEDLFEIEIDYAIKVGFNAVVEIVDLVGGIEVYSDIEFKSYHMPGWTVKKGNNYMDGKKALAYARERYAYAGGDRHRILNQQQVLEATLKKILSDKSILLKYDKLLNSLSKFYITDIPRDEISKYVKMQLNDMSSWKFISQSVDGTSAMKPTYVAPNTNLYVMVPNQKTVDLARSKMKTVLEAK